MTLSLETPPECRPVILFGNGLYRIACIVYKCRRHGKQPVIRYADPEKARREWEKSLL